VGGHGGVPETTNCGWELLRYSYELMAAICLQDPPLSIVVFKMNSPTSSDGIGGGRGGKGKVTSERRRRQRYE
jgi:hypothetical protein